MGIEMKKTLLCITLTLSIGLMIFPTKPVYAGDINAVEQDVINYCSGIFYYEGKAYKATPSAVSRAYAELASDERDLTPEQGEAAKRLAANNVQRAIEEGYLVEVDMPQETSSINNTEVGSDEQLTTSEVGSSKEEMSTNDVTLDVTEDVITDNVVTGENDTTGAFEETTTEPDTSVAEEDGTTKEKETSTLDSGTDQSETTKQDVSVPETDEIGTTMPNVSVPESDEIENKVTGNGEIIDIENVIQGTNAEVIVNQNTEQETLYNVQDYINGEELVVKDDGEVIYQNKLPVKNTGYNLVKGKFVFITIVFFFLLNILVALMFSKEMEKR